MFRTTKFSSSGRLYKQFEGIIPCICISSLVTVRMCLILTPVSNTSWQRLGCLYRCMIKCRKAACTFFLMMNTWLFETCRRQYNWIKSLMKKVWILLVLLTYVKERMLYRTALKPDNYLVNYISTSWKTGFDTVQGCDCMNLITISRSERRLAHTTGSWIRESVNEQIGWLVKLATQLYLWQ